MFLILGNHGHVKLFDKDRIDMYLSLIKRKRFAIRSRRSDLGRSIETQQSSFVSQHL